MCRGSGSSHGPPEKSSTAVISLSPWMSLLSRPGFTGVAGVSSIFNTAIISVDFKGYFIVQFFRFACQPHPVQNGSPVAEHPPVPAPGPVVSGNRLSVVYPDGVHRCAEGLPVIMEINGLAQAVALQADDAGLTGVRHKRSQEIFGDRSLPFSQPVIFLQCHTASPV